MCDFDTEFLILAVEKYPCLWDLQEESYHIRELKDLAWEDVCKEIFSDWETMNDAEKRKKCSDLKKKWNNVRDSYRKDINRVKNTRTGSSAKKQKRYIYADVLSFLAPIFKNKSHEGNYEEEEEKSTEETQEEEETCVTANAIFNCNKATEDNDSGRDRKKDVPNQILNLIQHRREQLIENDDDDSMFLLSFRSDMRAMTKSQKLDFKIGMLELVKKIDQ